MRRGRRLVVLGAVLLLLAGVASLAVGVGGSRSRAPEVYGVVPAFTLVDRSGREVGLSDLRGHVWVANFIYTSCKDTCPTQSLQLSRLQAHLADAADFRLVSITVDPSHDTPVVLRRYAESFGATDRWFFLTGNAHDIECLATRGFHLPIGRAALPDCGPRLSLGPAVAEAHEAPNEAERLVHSDRLVLVDRQGRIRGYEVSTEPDVVARLEAGVRRLLAEH